MISDEQRLVLIVASSSPFSALVAFAPGILYEFLHRSSRPPSDDLSRGDRMG
jgi:hypothetical protein